MRRWTTSSLDQSASIRSWTSFASAAFNTKRRYLADLAADGRTVVKVDPDAYADGRQAIACEWPPQATVTAMESGADVIYQATFFDGRWRGHADFLLKVDTKPSRFGAYHYEVADTKLARHVKASALLQICTYVDMLSPIQGVRPELMHVALGGSARAVEHFRVDDFMAYYRSARDRFEAAVSSAATARLSAAAYLSGPGRALRRVPLERACTIRRRADDHLSLVAGITRAPTPRADRDEG